MTYYRGIKIQDNAVEKSVSSKAGVYRGVAWKSEDLEKSPKAPRKGVYRGVKWVA